MCQQVKNMSLILLQMVEENSFESPSLPVALVFSKIIKELNIFFSVKFSSQDSGCSVVNEGTARSFKKSHFEYSLVIYFSLQRC